MSLWRRYLLARAVWRLGRARLGLHLIPQGHELHRQISEHLLEVGGWAAPLVLLRMAANLRPRRVRIVVV